MNHVVWANNKITDIGSRIWNKELISRDIIYISDFLNSDNSLMSYKQFRIKWNLEITDISSNAYVDIKMALRNFTLQFSSTCLSPSDLYTGDTKACLHMDP